MREVSEMPFKKGSHSFERKKRRKVKPMRKKRGERFESVEGSLEIPAISWLCEEGGEE